MRKVAGLTQVAKSLPTCRKLSLRTTKRGMTSARPGSQARDMVAQASMELCQRMAKHLSALSFELEDGYKILGCSTYYH